MDILDRVSKIASSLNMVYTITSDEDKLSWLWREVHGFGKMGYNNLILFPSDEEYYFEVNDIDYFGLTVKNIYTKIYGSTELLTIIFSETIENINALYEYLTKKYYVKPPEPNPCTIMVWSTIHNSYTNSGDDIAYKTESDLVGIDDFFKSMERDINSIISRKELSKKLGLDSGFNYLIYGKPGTGKSSSVKALAYKLKLPIYCLNISNIAQSHILKALNPKNNAPIRIVLVEDFDRYISKRDKSMSDLLNALDGIQSAYGTIRIFSANYPEKVLEDAALRSRISRFIEFKMPTLENIMKHLLNIFPDNIKEVEIFSRLVMDKNMSIRQINNYLNRFIIDKDILAEAISHFPDWLIEIEKIKELEKKRPTSDIKPVMIGDDDDDVYPDLY